MKKADTGLGKFIYTEWIILVIDYYQILRAPEVVFEIITPLVCAALCSAYYYKIGKVYIALKHLSNILPTAISILIGFTAMLITLLLTSNNESINTLKANKLKKKIHNRSVSLYQGLHIQFSHILVSEIILLILVFFYLFSSGIGMSIVVAMLFLIVKIYLLLYILLSVLRGITSLYFAFYREKQIKK